MGRTHKSRYFNGLDISVTNDAPPAAPIMNLTIRFVDFDTKQDVLPPVEYLNLEQPFTLPRMEEPVAGYTTFSYFSESQDDDGRRYSPGQDIFADGNLTLYKLYYPAADVTVTYEFRDENNVKIAADMEFPVKVNSTLTLPNVPPVDGYVGMGYYRIGGSIYSPGATVRISSNTTIAALYATISLELFVDGQTSPILIGGATLLGMTPDGWMQYTVPTGASVDVPVSVNDIRKHDDSFTFSSLVVNYLPVADNAEITLSNVRAETLKLFYTGNNNATLRYSNVRAQDVETGGWNVDFVNDIQPLDPAKDSLFNAKVKQRFSITEANYSHLEVVFSGTVPSTMQVSGLSGREIVCTGRGDGTTLYQHSIQNAVFEDVIVKGQVISLLTITGVDYNQIRNITLDSITYTSVEVAEYFVNSILNNYTGSGLVINFINGSTIPTTEQIGAMEAKGIIVNIE